MKNLITTAILLVVVTVAVSAQCRGFNKNLKVTPGQAVKCLTLAEFLTLCQNSKPLQVSTINTLREIIEIAKHRGNLPNEVPETIDETNYVSIIKKYALVTNVVDVHTYDCYDSTTGTYGTWKRSPYIGEYGLEIFKIFFKSLACANSVLDHRAHYLSMISNTKKDQIKLPDPVLVTTVKKPEPIISSNRAVYDYAPGKKITQYPPDDTIRIPGKQVVINQPGDVQYVKGEKVVIKLPSDTIYEKQQVIVTGTHRHTVDTITNTVVVVEKNIYPSSVEYYHDERQDAVVAPMFTQQTVISSSNCNTCSNYRPIHTTDCGACNSKDLEYIANIRRSIEQVGQGRFSNKQEKTVYLSTEETLKPVVIPNISDDVYQYAPYVPIKENPQTSPVDDAW